MQNQNRRSNYWQKRPSNNYITDSSCGLLFTVDGDDKRALREAFAVIDRFLPHDETVHQPAMSGDEDGDEPRAANSSNSREDISDVLTKMCGSGRSNGRPKAHGSGVRQLDTGVKHTLLFAAPGVLTPANIYDVVDAMIDECQKTPRCRFLARVVPVEDTCVGASVEALSNRVEKLIARHLQHEDFVGESPSYAVDFRSRNSDLLSRDAAIDVVTGVMGRVSPDSRVNLTKPDLLVMVNVMRKTVLLSCVRRYAERNKFAVRPLESKTDAEQADKPSESKTDAEQENNNDGA